MPAETNAELARLQPCYIVIVGGTATVSDTVANQADQHTDPAACP